MKTTRRAFLTRATNAAIATTAALGAGVIVTACSDSDTEDGTSGGGGSGTQGCTDDIQGNHGHELSVPQADVDAGADVTYDITGTSPHSHEVTVTAADFMALQGGGSVMIESTDGGSGHTHMVTITC